MQLTSPPWPNRNPWWGPIISGNPSAGTLVPHRPQTRPGAARNSNPGCLAAPEAGLIPVWNSGGGCKSRTSHGTSNIGYIPISKRSPSSSKYWQRKMRLAFLVGRSSTESPR